MDYARRGCPADGLRRVLDCSSVVALVLTRVCVGKLCSLCSSKRIANSHTDGSCGCVATPHMSQAGEESDIELILWSWYTDSIGSVRFSLYFRGIFYVGSLFLCGAALRSRMELRQFE